MSVTGINEVERGDGSCVPYRLRKMERENRPLVS